MEKKYYSLIDEEITEQEIDNGVADFQVGYYENGRLLKKEVFLNNLLAHVVYSMGEQPLESVVEGHLKNYTPVRFFVLPAPENDRTTALSFDEKGNFISRQVSFYEQDNVYVDELYDPSGKLMGGTKYLEEGEDFIVALEFDGEKKYYNGYDFKTGDSVPVAEAIASFPAMPKE